MGFVSGLALVLLTLVGYSSGSVLAGKGKQVVPGLLDLAAAVLLWAVALTTRAALGKGLAILVWLVVGLTVSAGLTGLRRGRYPDRKQMSPAAAQDAGGLRRWWEGWKVFAFEMGNYQGRTLLAFFYFFVVTPFGIPLRLFGDPLRLRRVGGSSSWVERQPVSHRLEKAREQF
jgi:hypothetical protein